MLRINCIVKPVCMTDPFSTRIICFNFLKYHTRKEYISCGFDLIQPSDALLHQTTFFFRADFLFPFFSTLLVYVSWLLRYEHKNSRNKILPSKYSTHCIVWHTLKKNIDYNRFNCSLINWVNNEEFSILTSFFLVFSWF